jgi:hypothetical protein
MKDKIKKRLVKMLLKFYLGFIKKLKNIFYDIRIKEKNYLEI